ncbi:preprotein translocase subunit SecE [Thermaerobacter marianensis]|nr:preprotein translocase subunit SecE [Thermaerobacter marianensis]
MGRAASVRGAWERMARFFRQTVAELRRVVWPNRQQTVTYTAVVLGTVAFLAALIWVVDFVIRKVLELVLPG